MHGRPTKTAAVANAADEGRHSPGPPHTRPNIRQGQHDVNDRSPPSGATSHGHNHRSIPASTREQRNRTNGSPREPQQPSLAPAAAKIPEPARKNRRRKLTELTESTATAA